jgi:hypothetical protein
VGLWQSLINLTDTEVLGANNGVADLVRWSGPQVDEAASRIGHEDILSNPEIPTRLTHRSLHGYFDPQLSNYFSQLARASVLTGPVFD